MIRKIDNKDMGKSNLGWLKSSFHFSFAEYFNPLNIRFGILRVINDDLIAAHTGFDTHPHKDMEIVTYVINGELTHKDSMGNGNTLKRGEVQYMSAGTGVLHSEINESDDEIRTLQIWILPDAIDHTPNYGDYRFPWEDRINKWAQIVSSKLGNGPVRINQDVNIYVSYLEKDKNLLFEVNEGRQAYLVQIEGNSVINNVKLNEKDAVEIYEENINIIAKENSHFLILEMKKM